MSIYPNLVSTTHAENATPRNSLPTREYSRVSDSDADVLRSRAITPEVAAARGYRTVSGSESTSYGFRNSHARDGLLLPSYNTQGEVDQWQMRPREPLLDEDGKPRKYVWPIGTRLQIDVPPASLPYLLDVNVTIIITESILKADAIQSTIIAPGTFCVLAISGVYGWRSQGAPLSDFGDIRWRLKEHDRITFRRLVYIAFDSDTLTNPNVSRARYEFTDYLRRRKARVSWIDVPTAVDGDKQGIDDALAAGHTLESMIKSAYPAPDIMPADFGPATATDRVPEVERLRAENAQLQHDNAMLVHLVKNPHVQGKTKSVVVSIYCEAASKRSRGQVEHDGRIRLDARHVANDHRPIPEPGQPRAEINPLDGSKPIVARSTVVSIAQKAAKLGFVNVETVKERKRHASGAWYWDTELLVTPAASLGAFLQPMATHVPTDLEPRKPYTVQKPCPHCNEVHSRTRTTVCNGCDKPTDIEILPIPIAQDPNASEADRAAMTKNLMARSRFGRPSRNSLSTKNVMADGREVDPDTGEILTGVVAS